MKFWYFFTNNVPWHTEKVTDYVIIITICCNGALQKKKSPHKKKVLCFLFFPQRRTPMTTNLTVFVLLGNYSTTKTLFWNFFHLQQGSTHKMLLLAKKERKYIFQVNRTLNSSSVVGGKKKSDCKLQQYSAKTFFYLWETGSSKWQQSSQTVKPLAKQTPALQQHSLHWNLHPLN